MIVAVNRDADEDFYNREISGYTTRACLNSWRIRETGCCFL